MLIATFAIPMCAMMVGLLIQQWRIVELESQVEKVKAAGEAILSEFDDIDDWYLGDETDCVFAWHQLEPLDIAINGESRHRSQTLNPRIRKWL